MIWSIRNLKSEFLLTPVYTMYYHGPLGNIALMGQCYMLLFSSLVYLYADT